MCANYNMDSADSKADSSADNNVPMVYVDKCIDLSAKQKDITMFQSIRENWLSWTFFFIAVYLISKDNPWLGYVTFFLAIFAAYVGHVYLHQVDNLFTCLHRYHHEHNNYFSHYSQVVLEINCASVCYLLYQVTGELWGDPWTLFFALFFYSTVHNINYGYFRVNDVHRLHHKDVYANIGPDIFDVMFGSKHPTEACVENTNHYIPNIIIGAAITLAAKYMYENNELVSTWTPNVLFIFFTCTLTFALVSSVYIQWFMNKK